MSFLPIVERELRVAARRHSTHVARLVVALGAMFVGFFFFVAPLPGGSQLVAERTFWGLAVLALVYCLHSGRRSTADCLSQEKREGTLGLLFLTNLNGYDVVLGKLAATSLNGLYCLVGMVPVLAVPLLLGGISYPEFWRMVVVLLDAFFFSLAVGVFASVLCRQARLAFGVNFLLLLLLGAVPAAAAAAFAYFSPSHKLIHPLLYSCPAYPFYLCADIRYAPQKWDFWCAVALIHALTWLLIIAASQWVLLTWRDEPSRKPVRRWREFWHDWLYGHPLARNAHRQRLLAVNAYYWLASRARRKAAGVWIFLAWVLGWWAFVRWEVGPETADVSFTLGAALVLNAVFKVWVAIESGQRLAEDHQTGALELLLSTPLGARGILHGQFLALRRQFLKPVLAVVAAELLLALALLRRGQSDDSALAAVALVAILLLLVDAIAVAWVAMASALTTRNPNQATVQAMWRVLMLPWVLFGVVWVMAVIGALLAGKNGFGWRFYLHLWFWLGLAVDLAYGLPAWWRVRHRFGTLASRRYNSQADRFPHPIA